MSGVEFLEKLLDGAAVEWTPLGMVAEYVRGLVYNKSSESSDGHGYKVLRANNITLASNQLNFDDIKVVNFDTKVKNTQRLYKNDILISAASGSREHVGKVAFIDADIDFYFGGFMGVVRCSNGLNSRYMFHVLTSDIFQKYLDEMLNSSTINNLNSTVMGEFKIPIPFPENPKKSLEIQAEIVRILDAFTELTTELTTELVMRKRQHKHYQFEILQFAATTQYLKIGDCCDIKKGLTPIKKVTPGEYPLVATTEERQSSSEYQFDCAAVCVPLISSRGHGVASIDRIYFQDGKFALGNILCAIIPNDSGFLSAKFLRHYLFDRKDVLVVPLMRGGANVSLTLDSLKKIEIPIPPIADQQRVVHILDKFDELVKGLTREIELRQKQFEYYRDLLLSFPKPDGEIA